MRAEAERNLFNGLGRRWSVLPFHHGRGSTFCEDGIATPNLHLGDRTVGKHSGTQSNQTANLFVFQKRGIIGFHRGHHPAGGLRRLLSLRKGYEAGGTGEPKR